MLVAPARSGCHDLGKNFHVIDMEEKLHGQLSADVIFFLWSGLTS
jgi:hypothetical protein